MSTNLEYTERERQKKRKRESRRLASEAQRQEERRTVRVRDKGQERHFLFEEQQENFVGAVRK